MYIAYYFRESAYLSSSFLANVNSLSRLDANRNVTRHFVSFCIAFHDESIWVAPRATTAPIKPRRIARSRSEGRIIRLKLTLNHPLSSNPEPENRLVKRSIESNREIVISLPDICRGSGQSRRGRPTSAFFPALRTVEGRRIDLPLPWNGPNRWSQPEPGAPSRRGNGCLPITWQCPPSRCARNWRSSLLPGRAVESCFPGWKKGLLQKVLCEFPGRPRVITSRRTVTDCAKTIKERDSVPEIRPGGRAYDGEKTPYPSGDLIPLCSQAESFGASSIPSGQFSFRSKRFGKNAESDRRWDRSESVGRDTFKIPRSLMKSLRCIRAISGLPDGAPRWRCIDILCTRRRSDAPGGPTKIFQGRTLSPRLAPCSYATHPRHG